MWTLAEARERLGRRLAEVSTAFWDDTERNNALNEGQRMVCSLTKRLKDTVTGEVTSEMPSLTAGRVMTPSPFVRGEADGRALPGVPLEAADLNFPAWRARVGQPRHVLYDALSSTFTVTPAPEAPLTVSVSYSVLAADLVSDSQQLFDGAVHMEPYQDAVINHAAGVCLLKERYDGDAERFFTLALSQLALEVPRRVDG